MLVPLQPSKARELFAMKQFCSRNSYRIPYLEPAEYERYFMYGLRTESCFDAAHFLTNYNGKCENLHGHRWRVVAYIETEQLQSEGEKKDMVIDFGDFKSALKELTEEFDHSFIVEIGSLMPETIKCLEAEEFTLSFLPFRTTAENLAKYFFDKLVERGLPASRIEVYETPNNCAIYAPSK